MLGWPAEGTFRDTGGRIRVCGFTDGFGTLAIRRVSMGGFGLGEGEVARPRRGEVVGAAWGTSTLDGDSRFGGKSVTSTTRAAGGAMDGAGSRAAIVKAMPCSPNEASTKGLSVCVPVIAFPNSAACSVCH